MLWTVRKQSLQHGRIRCFAAQKELKEISRDKASGVTVQVTEGNMQKLTGFVEGPKDTAYDGGYFVVDIVLGGLSSKLHLPVDMP